jgi:hypothetical protein
MLGLIWETEGQIYFAIAEVHFGDQCLKRSL